MWPVRPVGWSALFAGRGARGVDLPTYAFQHQRYWLRMPVSGSGDVTAAGLRSAGHPLLGAAVEPAESDGLILTGRLSLREHPWLADHRVMGTVPLPGTAFVELAVVAGDLVECPHLEELTMQAPLTLPETGSLDLQLTVSAPDDTGRRELGFFARTDDEFAAGEWTRHATGVVRPADPVPETVQTGWPPRNAERIELGDLYEALADGPFAYGPAFQGLRAAWSHGRKVFAEVALGQELHEAAGEFLLHPALLDAALHAVGLGGLLDSGTGPLRPFAWNEVSLHATGATTLRVTLSPAGENAVSLHAVDGTGAPVVSVGSLLLRPVDLTDPGAGAGRSAAPSSLLALTWTPVPLPAAEAAPWAVVGAAPEWAGVESGAVCHPDLAALSASVAAGGPVPGFVVLALPDGDPGGAGLAALTRERAGLVLDVARSWVSEELDERLAAVPLAVTTTNAVGTSGEDTVSGLGSAPLWGLVRSVQSENPGRFVLLDTDGSVGSGRAVPAAVASGEAELALRGGVALAPRLHRPPTVDVPDTVPGTGLDALDPVGTVLVTGATGGLGALVATRLVELHGVRRLLLLSRRGPDAECAGELVGRLEESGAAVTLVACDAADRTALATVLDGIPDEHPLTAVVHCAGTAENALLASLGPELIDRVFRPRSTPRCICTSSPRARPVRLRAVLLDRGRPGEHRAGQLRRRQHLPGRPGAAAADTEPRRHLVGLGAVGGTERYGRRAQRGWPRRARDARGVRAVRPRRASPCSTSPWRSAEPVVFRPG